MRIWVLGFAQLKSLNLLSSLMDQQGEGLEHVINVISSEISTHTRYLIPEFVHEHGVPAYL